MAGSAGFTLMEILAALVLIALVLPAVMKGLSLVTIVTSETARKYEALDQAEAKLAEILLQEDWKDGTKSGVFEDNEDYEWTMDAANWTESGLKQVDVTVFWEQRGRYKEITLSTLVYNAQ